MDESIEYSVFRRGAIMVKGIDKSEKIATVN